MYKVNSLEEVTRVRAMYIAEPTSMSILKNPKLIDTRFFISVVREGPDSFSFFVSEWTIKNIDKGYDCLENYTNPRMLIGGSAKVDIVVLRELISSIEDELGDIELTNLVKLDNDEESLYFNKRLLDLVETKISELSDMESESDDAITFHAFLKNSKSKSYDKYLEQIDEGCIIEKGKIYICIQEGGLNCLDKKIAFIIRVDSLAKIDLMLLSTFGCRCISPEAIHKADSYIIKELLGIKTPDEGVAISILFRDIPYDLKFKYYLVKDRNTYGEFRDLTDAYVENKLLEVSDS